MTYTIAIRSVYTSIAALTFPSGVTCVDVTGIPENGNMLAGILYPNPENGLAQTTDAKNMTFGIDDARKVDLEHDIYYRYLHCAHGGGVILLGNALDDAMETIVGILKVFVTKNTLVGIESIKLKSSSRWPITVNDPAGNSFWGCDFTLHVIEYLQ